MRFKEILKNIIIIFLLIILVTVFYSKFIKKEEPIKIFGKSFLIVTTGSMEPTINSGELIIISECNSYKKGDIVTYVDEDNFLITHRIIEIDTKNMITRGDANNIQDDRIGLNTIKGKVIFHSKILGFFILYLLKPIIIAYVIVLMIINIISTLISKNEKGNIDYEKNNENNKKLEDINN